MCPDQMMSHAELGPVWEKGSSAEANCGTVHSTGLQLGGYAPAENTPSGEQGYPENTLETHGIWKITVSPGATSKVSVGPPTTMVCVSATVMEVTAKRVRAVVMVVLCIKVDLSLKVILSSRPSNSGATRGRRRR